MASEIVEQVLAGDRHAIARLITHVENQHPQVQTILNELYPQTGQAHLIGVTGSPGTGKSSLVNKLVKFYRQQDDRAVAVIAVDPTSPFTGGALLGDRVRMRELSGDGQVFIRSMASRGSLGGLAQAVDDVIKVLDAARFELIMIETVGAGQSEVEIAKTAHTVIVVEAPGLGDDVQAIKAGILEIADIFVVNKADRPGVERTLAALKAMLELGQSTTKRVMHHGQIMTFETAPVSEAEPQEQGWQIPVLKATALKEEGINEIAAAIDQHWVYLTESGELRDRNRTRLIDELEAVLQQTLIKRVLAQVPPEYWSNLTTRLIEREVSPYTAVQELLEQWR
ncbi:MAG: methylmalonyl Co-A mutase-associated GTPase MeaB [Anaerolineae bacterium]|nr:methylmalonyl Co-A mutase-associated GTPase MeaB [Anaerolineae bacterium]